MNIGVITLHLIIPGCASLKEKRSRIKPLLARLHREFNLSAAEVGHLDNWQESLVACALVSNDAVFTQKALAPIPHFVESTWPDLDLIDDRVEIIPV